MIDKTDGKNPIKQKHYWRHTLQTLAPHGLMLKMILKFQFTCIYISLVPCISLLHIIIVILIVAAAVVIIVPVISNALYYYCSENDCYSGDKNNIINNGNSKNAIITIIFIISTSDSTIVSTSYSY